MQDIRIGKFAARYHLPAAARAERHRLDQAMKAALDASLESALADAGSPAGGEFCIRRLRVPVRLRLASTDAALAAEWRRALAAELAQAMRDGRAVVYASRRQALLEMAVDVARGTWHRAWAWRQLGLWQATEFAGESEAIFELMRALGDEPATIVPALRTLEEAGALVQLCARMTGRHWETLAHAALTEAGIAWPAKDFVKEPAEASDRTPDARAVREAWRVLDGSRLLRGVLASGATVERQLAVCQALAALALLETEPALLRTERAPALIALVAEAVRTARFNPPIAEARQANPDSDRQSHETGEQELETESKQELKQIAPRQQAQTQFGGLLFLLGLIEDAGMVDEMLAHDALGLRPLRWTMQALALALVPAGIGDAAVLAFAGLPPDAAPPVAVAQPMSEAEAVALQSLAARIVERLRSLLEWPEEAADALMEFVCWRQAEILADPGWIEVRLPLDEVSTEIRRAGLDLDPGYFPWLGVVVRFVYA